MKKYILLTIMILFAAFISKADTVEVYFNYKNIVINADTVKNNANFLIFDATVIKVVAGGSFAKKTEFSLSLLPKGLYYIYVWIDDKFYYKKFIII